MPRKILNILTQNLPFKILAVGLAFILWLVVYNIDDPNITQTYTAKVTIENGATITEQGKCYQVLDNSNIVTFAVTAKRSILRNLDSTNFRATADMNRMIISEDGKIGNVPVEISSTRSNSSLNYLNRKELKVSLEELVSKRLLVTAASTGTVAEGYALGDVTVTNPSTLKVSGPKSIVDQVASVVASIDVEGMAINPMTDNVIPVLYDMDGNIIDASRLTLSNTTVAVVARILLVNELPLNFSVIGTPDENYRVVGITSSLETVRVKGAASVINPVQAINIPADTIDVSGATEDINMVIDIKEYLPEGVSLVNTADARVSVTVKIEPYRSQRCLIRREQITIVGLDSEYSASVSGTFSVVINGLQKDLSRLNSSSITGSIDVTGLDAGTHLLPLILDLNEDIYEYQPMDVSVTISRILGDEPEDGGEGDEKQERGPTDGGNPEEMQPEN